MEAPEIEHPKAEEPLRPSFTHEQVLRVVIGVMLCIFLAAIDQTVVIPAVPAIAADLHGFDHLSWIITAYLLTSTVCTPFYGKLSDVFGRRALLLPAIVIFVVTSVMCGFAQSLWQLILGRALQGLGGAGLMSMAQAAIADVVSPRERGRYQAYMTGSWVVASVAGPMIGGWATDVLSWRWIFWANLPIGIGAYLLSSNALRMLKVQRRQVKIDTLGSVFMSIGTTAFLLVLSWGGSNYAWTSPELLGTAAICVVFMTAFVWQERRFADPLIPPRLFASGVFTRAVLIVGCNSSCMLGIIFLLPLMFQLTRGSDASTSGTQIVPYLLASCIGSLITGNLGRRFGRLKPIIIGGLSLTLFGAILLATVDDGTSEVWLAVLQLVTGIGIGMVQPSTLLTIQNSAERRDVGAATGVFLFVRTLGGALGSTIAGTLLASLFAGAMAREGLADKVELGQLREASGTQVTLDPAVIASAHHALLTAFHAAFAACAVLIVIAFIATLSLKDVKLRSSN